MPIEFLPEETNDTNRWIVWFPAVVQGRPIRCGISYQALRIHFGADLDDPLPAFIAHHHRIEHVMTAFIRQGRLAGGETLVIRAHELRQEDLPP